MITRLFIFISTHFFFYSSLFSQALPPPVVAPSDEVLVDKVSASVDTEVALFSEIQHKVTVGPLVVVSPYPADTSSPPFEQGLQDSINLILIQKAAKQYEIDFTEQQIEEEIQNFLTSQRSSKADLMQFLQEQKKSYEDYKKDFRQQMIVRRFQGRVINPFLKITEKDLELYYIKKLGTTARGDLIELTLRQLVLKSPTNSSSEIIKAKEQQAKDIYVRLKDGLNFDEAVKLYSDDPQARENGGKMPPYNLKDLAPPIRTAVQGLNKGSFSPPVKFGDEWRIFYIEEKRFSGGLQFERMKQQLEYELRTLELQEQTRRWLAEQRTKYKITILR